MEEHMTSVNQNFLLVTSPLGCRRDTDHYCFIVKSTVISIPALGNGSSWLYWLLSLRCECPRQVCSREAPADSQEKDGSQATSAAWAHGCKQLPPGSTHRRSCTLVDNGAKRDLLCYPHSSHPISAPGKEERMVQAVRTQADKQCRMQGQPMVLHVTLSGPGREAKPAPEQLWTARHVQQQQGVRVSASSARPRAKPPVEGRRKEESSLWVRGDEGVTVIPCAGSGEGRKESATARGGTTPNLSGTGRLGTLLWVTNRWPAGNLKHTQARSNTRAVIMTQVSWIPIWYPVPEIMLLCISH